MGDEHATNDSSATSLCSLLVYLTILSSANTVHSLIKRNATVARTSFSAPLVRQIDFIVFVARYLTHNAEKKLFALGSESCTSCRRLGSDSCLSVYRRTRCNIQRGIIVRLMNNGLDRMLDGVIEDLSLCLPGSTEENHEDSASLAALKPRLEPRASRLLNGSANYCKRTFGLPVSI
jgi:hypothetical protein